MNILYHNQRCNKSRADLFHCNLPLDLKSYIEIPNNLRDQVVKCRIIYHKDIINIEYTPYNIRPVSSLFIVPSDNLNYDYKYLDRKNLDACYAHRQMYDDVLITKKGFITDTNYGNVAFLQNGKWYTPINPLLKGTRRQQLIDKKRIFESAIHVNTLQSYSKVTIFNAMIPMGKIILSVKNIFKH